MVTGERSVPLTLEMLLPNRGVYGISFATDEHWGGCIAIGTPILGSDVQ